MGNLIKYTLNLENVSSDIRWSLYHAYEHISSTGVSANRDLSAISFFLTDKEHLEDYAVIPPDCSIMVEGTP